MNRMLTCILLIATVMGASAQQTRILTADKHNEYGLVYTLPTTALRVEVTAQRTLQLAGPYWQYAKKYIGTDKVIRQDAEKWDILNVKVTPYGVADRDTQYLMQLRPGAMTYIAVGADGMLLAINAETEAPETVTAGQSAESLRPAPDIREYLQYVNEDFVSSQSTAKQAQNLAANMMEVRDAKVSLTRGTAETMPTDGRQLEIMLESLRHQESAFTAAFAGLVQRDTVTRVYTCIPDKEGKTILFRMSDFAGFVESDDYSGDPVYLNISDIREAEMPVNEKGEEKKLPKDAVMYRVPGTASISVIYKGRALWSGDGEFAQYGVDFGLQPSLFSERRGKSYAIFDTATGALKEIGEVAAE